MDFGDKLLPLARSLFDPPAAAGESIKPSFKLWPQRLCEANYSPATPHWHLFRQPAILIGMATAKTFHFVGAYRLAVAVGLWHLIAAQVTLGQPVNQALERRFTEVIQPLLSTYCIGCHGEQKREAKLKLMVTRLRRSWCRIFMFGTGSSAVGC